jgi:hypothetical protein
MLLSSRPSRNAPVSSDRLYGAFCMLTIQAVSTPSLHTKEPSTEWQAQDFQEFVPQTFEGQMVRTWLLFRSQCGLFYLRAVPPVTTVLANMYLDSQHCGL